MKVDYRIELVGGQYDGVAGMHWKAGPQWPLPQLIFVGACPGDGACTGSLHHCRALARAVGSTEGRHPSFWIEQEMGRPPGAERYRLTSDEVFEAEPGKGRAVYARGGLRPVGEGGAAVALPEPATHAGRRARELVPAGRHERGWPRA